MLTVLALPWYIRTGDAEIGAPAFGGLGFSKLGAAAVHLENHDRILGLRLMQNPSRALVVVATKQKIPSPPSYVMDGMRDHPCDRTPPC